jgi:hypothetical protein
LDVESFSLGDTLLIANVVYGRKQQIFGIMSLPALLPGKWKMAYTLHRITKKSPSSLEEIQK